MRAVCISDEMYVFSTPLVLAVVGHVLFLSQPLDCRCVLLLMLALMLARQFCFSLNLVVVVAADMILMMLCCLWQSFD